MSKTSIISHASRSRMLILRADYLTICQFDECAAILLNEFEHKTNAQYDAIESVGEWAKPGTEAPVVDEWFFWSQEAMQIDLFFHYGERAIIGALDRLVEWGFISRRAGVRGELDHAYQYRLNVPEVQVAIDQPRESFDSALMRNRAAKMRNRSRKNAELSTNTEIKIKTKDKDGAPKAARPRDLIYDSISSTWKITGGALIGQIKSVLTGTAKKGAWAAAKFDLAVTDPQEVVDFGIWYARKYPGLNMPLTPSLIQTHFYAFRASQVKKIVTPEAVAKQAEYDEWLHSLPVHDSKWSSVGAAHVN